MVKCPICQGEVKVSYEDATLTDFVPKGLTIEYTLVIHCDIHGTFKQMYQRKDVIIP